MAAWACPMSSSSVIGSSGSPQMRSCLATAIPTYSVTPHSLSNKDMPMARLAKAVVARELGKPVLVEQIEVAAPQHDEVTVRMAACGVCHSDLSATNGTINYPLPFVLGHEGAGVIVAVGDGVDNYAVGDHVVSSFVGMCGHCHYCQTGRPQLCVQSLKS